MQVQIHKDVHVVEASRAMTRTIDQWSLSLYFYSYQFALFAEWCLDIVDTGV
jgi:hypothetical protein